MHEFFSFNFPLREYFFCTSPAPPPPKFSNGPSFSHEVSGIPRQGGRGTPDFIDGDDRRILRGLKFSSSGSFWMG